MIGGVLRGLPWPMRARATTNGAVTAANPIAMAASIAAVVTALFIAGHAPLIPSTPDGIDSANFTLAIEQYDPRLHQPHPPGYPVHVALARLVSDVYRVLPSTGADG